MLFAVLYLARREKETVCEFITFIGKEFVQFSIDFSGGFT